MIDIITSGCSFTHNPNSWAQHLAKHYEKDSVSVINVAQGGVGQEHIVRSSLVALQKSKNKKICIAQFSGFTRMEVIVDEKERPALHSAIKLSKEYLNAREQQSDAFAGRITFNGLLEKRDWNNHYNDSIILLRTTDHGHNWYESRSTAGKMINRYEKTIGFDQRQMLTYEHIASLQWYCKLNNIPLFCFWGWDEHVMTGRSYNKEVVNASRDLVDWDNFWLYDETGGMAEWMIAQGHHGCLDEDHTNKPPKGWGFDRATGKKYMIGHPTPEAHKDFCDQVIVPWVNNVK